VRSTERQNMCCPQDLGNPRPSPARRAERPRHAQQAGTRNQQGRVTARERQRKFITFIRMFLQYSKQRDPELHQRVKATVKDCVEKHRGKAHGYESFTRITCARLRAVVQGGSVDHAESFMLHLLAGISESGSQVSQQLAEGNQISALEVIQLL